MKAIILDYGGTIDTRGEHWSKVLWKSYQKEQVPITYEEFQEAYVFTEKKLGNDEVIKPTDDFMEVLRTKTDIETQYLIDKNYWYTPELERRAVFEHIALDAFFYAKEIINLNASVLQRLHEHYPIVLVSNFYGNLDTVLREFHIHEYFDEVIESAKVGCRKPNTTIFKKAISYLDLSPEEILVVGDSEKNDIIPARSLGCETFQLREGETLKALDIFLQKCS